MRLIGQRCKRREALSLLILIGRGLVQRSLECLFHDVLLCFVWFCGCLKNAPLAQLVEQLTLNQWVLGSSPRWCTKRLVGQAVKTPPSHGGIGSSILPRVTRELKRMTGSSKIKLNKPVQIAVRIHLFPYRTQKLSSQTPKILGW